MIALLGEVGSSIPSFHISISGISAANSGFVLSVCFWLKMFTFRHAARPTTARLEDKSENVLE